MNFSILETTRRILSPHHELSCGWLLWRKLLVGLRERGKGRSRESGAFLLGWRGEVDARIQDFVLYDDLDPHSLDTGIVSFDGRHFGTLWEICKRKGMIVIADVHVHPGGAGQSPSDRANPMIPQRGHIALIIPEFADSPISRQDLGIYRYQGSKHWETIPPERHRAFFHIGL